MDEDREAGARDERVRNLERMDDQIFARLGKVETGLTDVKTGLAVVPALAERIGSVESDSMNIRTEQAAARGRSALWTVLVVVWPIVVGLIVTIVVIAIR